MTDQPKNLTLEQVLSVFRSRFDDVALLEGAEKPAFAVAINATAAIVRDEDGLAFIAMFAHAPDDAARSEVVSYHLMIGTSIFITPVQAAEINRHLQAARAEMFAENEDDAMGRLGLILEVQFTVDATETLLHELISIWLNEISKAVEIALYGSPQTSGYEGSDKASYAALMAEARDKALFADNDAEVLRGSHDTRAGLMTNGIGLDSYFRRL